MLIQRAAVYTKERPPVSVSTPPLALMTKMYRYETWIQARRMSFGKEEERYQ